MCEENFNIEDVNNQNRVVYIIYLRYWKDIRIRFDANVNYL